MHPEFLATLRTQGRIEPVGRFGDKSGGAYLLRAACLAEAAETASGHPAYVSGGWEITVCQWPAQ